MATPNFNDLLGSDPSFLSSSILTQQYITAMQQADISRADSLNKAISINTDNKSLAESAALVQQQTLVNIAAGAAGAIGGGSAALVSTTAALIGSQQEFYNQAAEFRVSFKDSNNIEQVFKFSLLPAMEVRGGGANIQIPDIKPGILLRTSMNIKRFAIPGAAPAFQVLGIEQSILQLVGLFIGNEDTRPSAGTSNANALYTAVDTRVLNATATANYFDKEVVQIGRPVKLYIYAPQNKPDAPLVIEYRCLIQAMRYFITRSDRVYYALEALVLDYRQQTQATIPVSNLGTNTTSLTGNVGASTQGVLSVNTETTTGGGVFGTTN